MECSYSKCSKPESDKTVTCWLCLNYYHLKCSGSSLRARDADALADSQKCLSWTCANCRKIGLEFYNLFKNSKAEFSKINQEFLSLQLKLAKFGELFTSYNNLDNFMNSLKNSSPKQKKKTVKNMATQCSLLTASNLSSVNESVSENPVLISDTSPKVLLTVNTDTCSTVELNNSTKTPTTPNVTSGGVEMTSNARVIVDHGGTDQSLVSPSISINKAPSIIKPLRVIPRNKSIFVSRLAADTTIEDVQAYLNLKYGTDLFSSVYKFSYSEPRRVSSFKITIADDFFNVVISPNFWPPGTFVREFVFKGKQGSSIHLPSSISTVSKN